MAAVIAGRAVPTAQGHERGVGVVGLQHRSDEHEEIGDPPLADCAGDGCVRVPLAQFARVHVGMGDCMVCGRRMRVQGLDEVVELRQIVHAQMYREGSEIHVFQRY